MNTKTRVKPKGNIEKVDGYFSLLIQMKNPKNGLFTGFFKLPVGFEPTTCALRMRCSTPEPRKHIQLYDRRVTNAQLYP